MNSVREIALAFCAAAIVTAAVGLLSGNRLQLSLRYIISLGLICSVLTSFSGKDFKFHYSKAAQTASSYSNESYYEKQAEAVIKQILNEKGITAQKISASATKSEENSIIINEIEILGCSDEQKAKQILNEKGVDCEIRVVE